MSDSFVQFSTVLGELFFAKNDKDFDWKLKYLDEKYKEVTVIFGSASSESSKQLFAYAKEQSKTWQGYFRLLKVDVEKCTQTKDDFNIDPCRRLSSVVMEMKSVGLLVMMV